MTDFSEVFLGLGYDYGAVGGPEFKTSIVATAAGFESRNQNWSIARGRWELGERAIVKARKDYLLADPAH